ncbi:amino acid ABC transporter permease [Campylobacter hyointestinalis]|uniref:amino acid ABC transporter permease n=1 Tax=Campylobacter hyointestinalis TaxID=198 RepID=UPI002552C579|nr:amino acid ABC transporter permease [Campylobacter hyointestinalis]MDL2346601.1 amino acid ABC transporter permease [Campylobacter hyointestinalis]MDL2348788.1 amino acid ABC transporter permease [Campylobacter hyointestinalis]MDL2350086.1 amino acid ABC transporter permease [Campylobacter hyointestinalis]MDM1026365.1 amino acid ABC transporter permease [Campylobacter hyointestinalis]MDM1027539.1 amino acid ABC transporter permease [Campylobacter hyointestinalis]
MNNLLETFIPMLKGAIFYTIPLSVISFFVGISIAVIVAIIRINTTKNFIIQISQIVCRFYVSIIRGTPLLVQLFIIFYGLPNIGVTLNPFISSIIAFSLNIGAYASETIRASILAVPKSQWEAGWSIGMTHLNTFIRIISPQAFKIALPTLSNTFIALVKDSSLASVVLVTELFREAQTIASQNYKFLLTYSEAALIYWVICIFLSYLQTRLEIKFSKHL